MDLAGCRFVSADFDMHRTTRMLFARGGETLELRLEPPCLGLPGGMGAGEPLKGLRRVPGAELERLPEAPHLGAFHDAVVAGELELLHLESEASDGLWLICKAHELVAR